MVLAQVAGHTNVASLLGVVTSGTPTLLVLKYCSNGTLLNLLHFRHANGPELTLDERVGDNYAPFYCLALPSILFVFSELITMTHPYDSSRSIHFVRVREP